MEATTNVIYITSSCNLACDYCYETSDRPNKTISYDEIDAFFKYIENHSSPFSHVSIFGGEPLLYPELVDYIIDKVIGEYNYKHYSISLFTNGILLLNDDIFNWFINTCKRGNISPTISYDGSHSFRRKDKLGNCVNDKIEAVMKKLDQVNDFLYSISFTLHKDNYDTCVEDIIEILETFSPYKISISINCKEIADKYGDYKMATELLRPYMIEIYKRYHIPICEYTCSLCKKCIPNNKNIYAVPSYIGGIESPKFTQKDFNLWSYIS